ncbi:V-type ATP synthase subunit I [bacterium]|nr:V-type ATP synthase subunit I [bacterium]
MSVVKMQKIRIIGLKEDKGALIRQLQKAEFIHLKNFEEGALDDYFSGHDPENEARHIAEKITHIESTISFLEQFNENKTLVENFFPARVEIDKQEFEKTVRNFNYEEIIKNTNDIKDKIFKIDDKISSMHDDIALLVPFKNLSWSPCQAKETQNTNSLFLKGPKGKYASLTERLSEKSATYVENISEDVDFAYLMLIYWKQNEGDISSVLKTEGFETLNLFLCDKLPSNAIDFYEKQIESLLKEKEKLFKKIKQILKCKDKLMMVHDWYLFGLQREKAKEHLRESETTFVLQGWVRKDDMNKIKETLQNKTHPTYIENIDPDEGEFPPIEIKNPALVRPFQPITKLFGLPHFGEVDPSGFVAPFFFIFFGLCLTDAGYGIVLIALTLLAMRKIKVGSEGKQFLRLFLLGGIATIFWGIVTGGWFGIEIAKLPQVLKALIIINPLENLMKFFILALSFGVVHILLGIGIEMYEQLRSRNFADAFADQLSYLIILPGAILWIISKQGFLSPKFSQAAFFIMIAGAGIMVVSSLFKKGRNPLLNALISLLGFIWKSKDLIGNVLSYSRLMALGLATSIIALVINILAGIALEQIPYLGILAALLIIIVGHLFNIAINTLGAFVHTTRLQFVEFFSYFFQGGGEAFQPLAQESKYIISKVKRSATTICSDVTSERAGRRTGGR